MPKVSIISQDADVTVIKCPSCKKPISLLHDGLNLPGYNNGIGRLDLGEQNYKHVVCPHETGKQDKNGKPKICQLARDIPVKQLR